jgi:hypothetical protein
MKKTYSPSKNSIFIKHSLVYAVVIMLSIFMMQSCIKKEEFDYNKIAAFNYDPNIAVPLIHSNLTLRNILNDYDTTHLFVEDGTGFLFLIYSSTVFSKRADQLISISDQNVNTSFNYSFGTIASNDSASTTHSNSYSFTTSFSERYDSIRIKSGTFNFNISGNISHNSRIDISIPSAKKNGVAFNKSISLTSGPVSINQNFDLSGYTLKFSSGNLIDINYKVTSFGDGNPASFNLSMGESFQNIAYKVIFGYLGKRSFTINQDSVVMEIFKNNVYGSMHFENPKLHIYANNAYGMPISLTFNTLEAYSQVNTPFVVPISGSGLTNPWLIAAPTFAQLGQSIQTAMDLDKTNSNIDDAINISPKWVTYNIDALSNPSGDPVNDQNFVIDTSRFNVDVEVELPLHGSAWDFRLQDTLNFSFGDDIDKAEWIKFKINTDNGFPIDARVQIYFVDSLYNKIDSLLAPFEQIIFAAPIGPPPDYRVTATNHKYVETTIYKNRLTALKNTDKMLIYSKMATINNGTSIVKIYSNYSIDVKLGVQVQGHYQVNVND